MSLTLSATAISAFLGCQKRWAYSYVDKLEPITKGEPLYRGSAIHEVVQAWWACEPVIPAFEKWKRETQQRLTPFEYANWEATEFVHVSKLMRRYFDHYKSQAPDVTVMATEFELYSQLTPRVRVRGFVDLIVNWQGQPWAVEIKTMRSRQRMAYLQVDPQVSLYVWALRKHGIPVAGVLFDSILTYPYKDLDKKPGDDLFQRVTLFPSDRQIAQLEEDMILVAQDMERVRKRKKYVRHLGGACTYCDFKEVCWAELDGNEQKAKALLRTDFQPREGR